MNIGVIGLGLIGGSMAKAIKNRTDHTVWGMDIVPQVVLKAKMVQVIDDDLRDERIPLCDMVIVALYPGDTVAFIRDHASLFRKDAIVIDCCGVKRTVYQDALRLSREHGFTFIGGHPMAGIEHSGFEYSRMELFQGAPMILTPDPQVDIAVLDEVKRFFLTIGFGSIKMSTPEEHDCVVAYTSQLAHVLSSAYVKSEAAMVHQGFSAGSFKDMTRVALLNEDMWTELFLLNRDNLAVEVEALATRLMGYAAAIRNGDEAALKSLLREGRERKQLLIQKEGSK